MITLFRLSFVFLMVLAASCSTTRPTKRSPDADTSFKVIDVHTHTEFDGKSERTSGIQQTRAQYLQELRDAGVVASISHTDEGSRGYDPTLKSENVIFCAGIGSRVDAAKLEADLKSGKFGCIKIYLGYVHQFAYDKKYEPAYRLAEKYDVPIVFHTGDTYSTSGKLKYSDPLTIDEVAVDHPKVKFVIAHCGNPWIQSAAEVAYKNPNVYLECSAMLIGDLSATDAQDVETYMVKPISWIFGFVENPEKIMFGTDWPLTKVGPYIDAYKRAIPQEHWNAVFYENAVKVFKFKR